jgi:hypothetical protein
MTGKDIPDAAAMLAKLCRRSGAFDGCGIVSWQDRPPIGSLPKASAPLFEPTLVSKGHHARQWLSSADDH